MSILVRHFIKEPKIFIEIGKLDVEEQEKVKLTEIVTLLYHQKLLNRVLEYLEEKDKQVFLELLVIGTGENYLEFLHQKIANLEEIVKEAIVGIEEQIMEDFREIKETN